MKKYIQDKIETLKCEIKRDFCIVHNKSNEIKKNFILDLEKILKDIEQKEKSKSKKEVEIKMQQFEAKVMDARLERDKYILNEVTFTFESDHRVFSIADNNKFTQIKTLKELNKTLKKIV